MIFEPIKAYCERQGPGLWEEPLSLIAATVMTVAALDLWRRLAGNRPYQLLALLLAVVGLASIVVHARINGLTTALVLSAMGLFALALFYRMLRDLSGLAPLPAAVGTLIFLPFTVAAMPLLTLSAAVEANLALAPFPMLMLGIAAVLRSQHAALAREVFVAALGLSVAIVLRGLDSPLCTVWPWGTHFLYILLSTAALVRLLSVMARHALAARGGGG